MQRKNRSRWFQELGPVCVVSVAALWVWLGGDETARFVRRVFAVLDPVAILEVGAGFAVIGIAVRLVPVEMSRRVSGRLGLWGRRLVGQASVSTGVVLSVVVSLVALVRVVLGWANHFPEFPGDALL